MASAKLQRIQKRQIFAYTKFKKGCFGHCQLGIGKLLFGGHSSEAFHCFRMHKQKLPNAQLPMPKATFFELGVYVSHFGTLAKIRTKLHTQKKKITL